MNVDQRYIRQTRFAAFGEEGQMKLQDSSVLICGCGALGSVLAESLTRAGVGVLRIVDRDFLEITNLHRQVLYDEYDVAAELPKVIAAERKLRKINSGVDIDAQVCDVDYTNIERLAAGVDCICDGTDNFETRFLINDLAVEERTPVVHGSVFRFEGQATVFDPARGGPCLRCLHPQPPPEGFCANCAEAGVLGVMPGIIGTIQAAEAIKWMLGQGVSMRGKLLIIDILNGVFRQISIPVDPLCTTCSQY